MVRLASFEQVQRALGRGRSLDLRSYLLGRGPLERALESAARRGARVRVTLERTPYGSHGDDLSRINHSVGRDLARAGCHVTYRHPIHAKVLVVDGKRYLDECNWNAGDFIVRDDNAAHVASHKRDAVAMEASLLASARPSDEVIAESERFDDRNPVFTALDRLAKSGAHPRLLLSQRAYATSSRARAAAERLVRDGAEVRLCGSSEKLAVVGDRAWLGSANATIDYGAGDPTDWGAITRSRSVVDTLRARLDQRLSS